MHGESVNRAVPLDIAGEVQDKTVGLAGSGADSSANLRNVVARAHRRTKHSNEIHFGDIELDGKHIDSNKIGGASLRDPFPICPPLRKYRSSISLIESSSEHAATCRLSWHQRLIAPCSMSTALIRSAMGSCRSVNRSGGGAGGEPQRVGSASYSTAWIRRTGTGTTSPA